MVYADESFYHEGYLLGRKPAISAGFNYYARQASQVIDHYTLGRLEGIPEEQIPEEVRLCCCEVAESVYRQEKQQSEADGKTSEKIGTYSVSYGTVQEGIMAFGLEQRGIIYKWLSETGLCYRGCG